ncbi:MAG: glycosyltransferase, partial [Myxococcales bacterium]|nr:glycosyltransferase [Myxococcales bacterium]
MASTYLVGACPSYVARVRIAVVIPALDEEESLPLVLGDLPPGMRVVVVDNGSTDGTARVAREGGAEVVSAPRRGYGTAVQAAMNHLRADPPDVLVI